MTSKRQKEEERPSVAEGALFTFLSPPGYGVAGEYGDQKAESATSDKAS